MPDLMVRSAAGASPDDASYRRENHEAPMWPSFETALSRLLRMKSVHHISKSIRCGISGMSAGGIG
jgi:hypothetical protein